MEYSAGKEKMVFYQHFLFLPKCFQKQNLSGMLRLGVKGKKLKGQKNQLIVGVHDLKLVSFIYTKQRQQKRQQKMDLSKPDVFI